MNRKSTCFLFLLLTPNAMAADTKLSPRAEASAASVHQAYERVRAEQTLLPPPGNIAESLLRLEALDQAGREAMHSIDLKTLDETEARAAIDASWSQVVAQDIANQKTLKALIPSEGWFRISVHGKAATTAAFLIVQHAVNDPALMRSVLAKMESLRPLGEVSGEDYALLYDRVALEFDHEPQRYGSQVRCVNGKMAPDNLEDPTQVDARRKAVGMKETEAQYLRHFPSSC